ncbi:hypothetical protein ABPG74_022409 [Tetrahymena malaccensis]
MELQRQLQCFSEFYLNKEVQYNSLKLKYLERDFSYSDANKLAQYKELRHLSLLVQSTSSYKALDLASSIKELNYLEDLQLNLKLWLNQFTYHKQSMFCYMGNLNNLKVLKLNIELNEASNLYKQEIFKQFTQQVSLLNSLEILKVCFKGYDIWNEQLTQFAKQIVKLINLQSIKLDFSKNEINNVGFQQIVSCLQKYPNLHALSLIFEENQIGDEGLLSLSQQVSQIPNLLKLKICLNNNFIKNQSLNPFIFSVSQCFQLQVLVLKFKKNCIQKINQSLLNEESNKIGYLQNLKKLNLDFSDMFLESNDISLLTNFISQISELKQLNLQFNQSSLSNLSLFELGSILEKIKSISEFTFSASNSLFTENGIQSLGEALSKCTLLKTVKIFVQKNNIDQQGVCQLIQSVFQLPLLSCLHLQLDFPEKICLETLSDELLKSKNLKTFSISLQGFLNKDLYDDGLKIIAKGLAGCQSLNNLTLLLNKSQYTEQGLKVLPNCINQLKNLNYFKIQSRPSIKLLQNQKNIFSRQFQKSRRLVAFELC